MKSNIFITIAVLLTAAAVTQSRRWFAPEVNCWITQEKVPASWEDAQRFCAIDGAVLASPLNVQLFDYMQTLITVHNHSAAYFLGTRVNRSDNGQNVQYVSLEGKQLDDMPSAVFDAIDILDLEQGDCLSMDRHGIRAVSCWDQLPYICYSKETTECGSAPVTTPTPTTIAPPPSSTIPPGYISVKGSTYKFHHQNHVTWFEANATCANEGAHLVVLNDVEEVNTVESIVRDAGGGPSWHSWVGLRDSRSGGVSDWRTVTGEPVSRVFHEWHVGQLHNDAQHTCALFAKQTKHLFDFSCDFKNFDVFFICEIS